MVNVKGFVDRSINLITMSGGHIAAHKASSRCRGMPGHSLQLAEHANRAQGSKEPWEYARAAQVRSFIPLRLVFSKQLQKVIRN